VWLFACSIKEVPMFRGVVAAACSILFAGLPGAATAGDWNRHAGPAWYDQHPWIGTSVGFYYSQHPDHIPAYPKPLTGYAVPIYETARPVTRVPRHRARFSAHVEWCAARYRSYDARSDTWQPYDGPRDYCRSPYR
jgi:hypothetical protein